MPFVFSSLRRRVLSGLSAWPVGREVFLKVQSILMKTHWRIYLLLALSWEGSLLLNEVGTLLLHLPSLMSRSFAFSPTHMLPLFPRCPYGKDLSTLSSPYSLVSQIMLCHDVRFPFYVNTFYQQSMRQHKLLAPPLKFRLPHYPDLSRIKSRRLK